MRIETEIHEVTELYDGRKLPDLRSVFDSHLKVEGLIPKWRYMFQPFWGPQYDCYVVFNNRLGGKSHWKMSFTLYDFDNVKWDMLGEAMFRNFKNAYNGLSDDSKMPGIDTIE